MTDRLSQSELEAFYDISVGFEEYDAGLDAFSNQINRLNVELNQMGGRDALSYTGVVDYLNDNWEYHKDVAQVTGKVYLTNTDFIDAAPSEWNGPYVDQGGSYYLLDGTSLVSDGVIDAAIYGMKPAVDDDSEYPVNLAYAFSLEDTPAGGPLFAATPTDLLTVRYDNPTYDALMNRLHTQWPSHMRYIETHLDSAGSDPKRLAKAIEDISRRVESDAAASDKFSKDLCRYLQRSVEFDRISPYIVTFAGEVTLFDPRTNDDTTLELESPVTRLLTFASISTARYTDTHNDEHFEYRLLFEEPTSQFHNEGIASRVLLNPSAIVNIRSTRPTASLQDTVEDMLRVNELELEAEELEPSFVIKEKTEEHVHPRIAIERRLEDYEAFLADTIEMVKHERAVRYRDKYEAINASMHLTNQIGSKINQLQLSKTDVLRVEGGVYTALSNLTVTEDRFHLDVNQETPIISPTMATDVIGSLETVVASVDRQEDEDGEFWIVAPRLSLVISDVHAPVVVSDYFEFVRAGVKYSAAVNLDGTAFIEVSHLEAIRRRKDTLAKVALKSRGTKLSKDLKSIDKGLMNELPTEVIYAGKPLLRTIRRVARQVVDGDLDESGIEALRQQLSNRIVAIEGESDSKDHGEVIASFSGVLHDIVVQETSSGPRLMAAIDQSINTHSADDEGVVFVALDSVTQLGF